MTDLSTCDREPIHIPGRLQTFGVLIAVSQDWIVSYASTNVDQLIGFSAEDIVGHPLTNFIQSDVIHSIRNRLQNLRGRDGVERLRGIHVMDGAPACDVSLHISTSNVVLEFEAAAKQAETDDIQSAVRSAINRLSSTKGLSRLCSDAARYMRAITGFDRVMIYQFLQDDSGEVIAEAKTSSLTPYLHLRYPASDIPKQARALYLRQSIRLIADVNDPCVRLYPEKNPDGQPLDLSQSALRAVSPIHIEYLKNMGVSASMSVSIIVRGKLWGLIACHHTHPLTLNQSKRGAAELFGQMFSLILDSQQREEEQEHDRTVQDLASSMPNVVAAAESTIDAMLEISSEFMSVFKGDGVAVYFDGKSATVGITPGEAHIDDLVRFLNRTAANQIYATSDIGSVYEPGRAFAGLAAGVLALPISKSPRDFILIFRRELARTVLWAGNPDKPVSSTAGVRISPRKSFEAWREVVEGQCSPWTALDIRAAAQLRITILETVLRLTDQAVKERKTAQEKQEILIAELNHRVRNILGLVRGLISQGQSQPQSQQMSTADYVQVLDSRIQSLARAHDQITQVNWSAAPFSGILETEAESYMGGIISRVTVRGPDHLLEPAAFSTVALVIHELVTNSAKYGALSVPQGRVTVTLSRNEMDDMLFCWEESGGPVVHAPNRRGFGSTIIERSIPFDLQGEAKITYAPTGLVAHFRIPAIYATEILGLNAREQALIHVNTMSIPSSIRRVLVLEDNFIIAMEAEDILLALDVDEVLMASSVKEARSFVDRIGLDGHRVDFALLDVSLGTETSFAFAQDLQARGIPFGFASGYGESAAFPGTLASVPRIAKPFDKQSISRLLTTATAQS